MLILILFLFSLPTLVSTDETCPPTCTCSIKYDSTIQNVICETGGLYDKDLARILSVLPESVISISIIGPPDNPNKFSISEDFTRFFDLEQLRLVNCGLRSLGKAIFAANKNLRTLDVSFNKISHLSPDTFDGMDHLHALDISSNDLWLDFMATGTFAYLKDLRSLNLSNNRIEYFPSNLFGELHQLTDLVLDYNFPDSKDLHILNQLSQLEYLSLAGCNVSYLPVSAFARNKRLKRLNLSRNDLRTMEIPALKHALQLEELDLSNNGIARIPDYLLSIFPKLRRLNLAGNHLGLRAFNDVFPPNAFARTNFSWLDLGENRFNSFEADKLGDARSSVRSLSLSGNKLAATDLANATRQLTSLTELHLSGIGITSLQNPLPPEFRHLKLLNISRNPLDQSIYNILLDMPDLEVLDISYCNITAPPPQHFVHFLSKLRAFYIHDNRWHCTCQLAPLRDFLTSVKTPSTCHELRFARIQCYTPQIIRGTPLALARLYGGCDGDMNETNGDLNFLSSPPSSGQLVINSEISILIAGVCIAVFIVIAFIIGIACSQLRPQASYRTHEDKVNLSANSVSGVGGLNNNEQDEMAPVSAPVGGVERLF